MIFLIIIIYIPVKRGRKRMKRLRACIFLSRKKREVQREKKIGTSVNHHPKWITLARGVLYKMYL